MRFKRLSIALAAILVLSILLPMTVAAAGAQEPAATTDQFMVITWLDRADNEEKWFNEYMEEKFNVDFQYNGIHPNENERVLVMLAAGEFPDMGMIWDDHGGPSLSLYEDGILRTIPHDMVRNYAPNIAALYDEYPLAWLKNTNPDNREEFVSLNGVSSTTDAMLSYVSFRADWAQKLGFPMDDYEAKRIPLDRFGRVYYYDRDYTWEDLEGLMYKFRDGDPDGNGKDDTIPYLTNKDIYRYWGPLAGAFGHGNASNFEMNMLYDGELIMQPISPTHKEFIKVMNKWYEEGLMDREFVTLDFWKSVDKVAAGRVGAFTSNIAQIGRPNLMNRAPNVGITEEEIAAGASFTLIPPITGPDGYKGTEAYSSIAPLRNYNFQVNANVDDAKLIRILQILDWFRGTLEGKVFTRFGKPDVHFDWAGEPWKSEPVVRDPADVPEGYPKSGGAGLYPTFGTAEDNSILWPKQLFDGYMTVTQSPKIRALEYRDYRYDIFDETRYVELKGKYWSAMTTLTTEFFFGGITGKIDVDAEWDAYVNRWREMGGDELLAELQKAPLVENLRNGEIKY